MIDLINFERTCDFTSFKLIIPSVSVGNLGQLTADLIISTFNLKRCATLWHPGLIPMAGSNPYSSRSSSICSACELYVDEQLKLVILQLRSSIEPKLAKDFFLKLKEEIVRMKFSKVIILTSTFAYELHKIESSLFRYISEDKDFVSSSVSFEEMPLGQDGNYFVSGSGFAVKLYGILKEVIPTTVLIKYVSEGDNRPDAVMTLDLLRKMFGGNMNEKRMIKYPESWKFVFGNPPPIGIF